MPNLFRPNLRKSRRNQTGIHYWRFIHISVSRAECFSYVFILLLIAYDFWATRRIHRATIWGGTFLVATQLLALQFGETTVWHSFAGWVQSLAQR